MAPPNGAPYARGVGETMRLACFQGPEEPGDPATNLNCLDRIAWQAGGRGARLLVCPELFLTGYNIGAATIARLAEPADGPSACAASDIARGSGVALLYGYPERGEDGRV